MIYNEPYKGSSDMTVNNLINTLIDAVPSIKPNYEKAQQEWKTLFNHLSDQDRDVLNELSIANKTPRSSSDLPITQFVEDVFVPHFVALVRSEEQRCLLESRAALRVLEDILGGSLFDDKNAIVVSFCESLLTTYEDDIKYFISDLGKYTRSTFVEQLEEYVVSDDTRRLFNI